jgi:GT2 family glycosyltransferase
MFNERPLARKWVIWFDDDSHLTRGDWLQRLALKIEREPEIAQWGRGYALWRHDSTIDAFIKSASWYRGLPLMRGPDLDGREAARFHFATGGFWAMKSEVIRRLDWPDPRIIHANEDFLLGEALRQNGYRLGEFHYGMMVNDAPRRNSMASETEELPPA